MRNYNEVIAEAKKYPELRYEIKEIEEMKSKKHNIKNNIESLKNILIKITNEHTTKTR